MAKSWEEIKKERMLNSKASEIVRPKIYDSRPTKSFDTDRNLEVGALTARKSAPLATVEKKSWLDVKKERGYVEPEKRTC